MMHPHAFISCPQRSSFPSFPTMPILFLLFAYAIIDDFPATVASCLLLPMRGLVWFYQARILEVVSVALVIRHILRHLDDAPPTPTAPAPPAEPATPPRHPPTPTTPPPPPVARRVKELRTSSAGSLLPPRRPTPTTPAPRRRPTPTTSLPLGVGLRVQELRSSSSGSPRSRLPTWREAVETSPRPPPPPAEERVRQAVSGPEVEMVDAPPVKLVRFVPGEVTDVVDVINWLEPEMQHRYVFGPTDHQGDYTMDDDEEVERESREYHDILRSMQAEGHHDDYAKL